MYIFLKWIKLLYYYYYYYYCYYCYYYYYHSYYYLSFYCLFFLFGGDWQGYHGLSPGLPHIDPTPDYVLISASESNGYTNLQFERETTTDRRRRRSSWCSVSGKEYSYFEKGCRKKCKRQSRKALWVVLSSLFFGEWNMFASSKRKQQK